MSKQFANLAFCLLVFLMGNAISAQDWQAEDYTLTMSGALINDHCGRTWENGEYISIHACNYQLANSFTLDVSTQHFQECTVLAQGDIVQIADCMVVRFNDWIEQLEKQ